MSGHLWEIALGLLVLFAGGIGVTRRSRRKSLKYHVEAYVERKWGGFRLACRSLTGEWRDEVFYGELAGKPINYVVNTHKSGFPRSHYLQLGDREYREATTRRTRDLETLEKLYLTFLDRELEQPRIKTTP